MNVATNVSAPDATSIATPSWGLVARTQLRAVGLALRSDLIVGALLLIAMTLLLDFNIMLRVGKYDHANVTMQLVLLGLFVPMTVWKGDEPSRRAYHWAMPVDHAPHALLKVATGWTWMTTLGAAFMIVVLIAALASGGAVQTGGGMERELMKRLGDAFDHQDLTFHGHAWLWLVPLTSMTVAYLFGSIVALSTDHPWRYYGAFLFVIVMLVAVSLSGGVTSGPLAPVQKQVLNGPYGLSTLLGGSHDRTFDAGVWFGAAAVWMSAAIVGVLVAAFRRQER